MPGEASVMVPGIQVEDDHFLAHLLDDPRFKGKDDKNLTRLKQYRILEEREKDLNSATGGNETFLRGCDIRVLIDYDVEAHLDRAIELINRTNQLNFTKKRLSEEIELARRELRSSLGQFNHQAGLIRVVDRYGDYGYIGFFMTNSLPLDPGDGGQFIELVHFCFSCRTLGMGIEQWVFKWLGRPQLRVVSKVLTDLTIIRDIDWIRQVTSVDGPEEAAAISTIAPLIVLLGGCEAQAVGIFLGQHTPDLKIISSYTTNGLMVSAGSSDIILHDWKAQRDLFEEEAKGLGLVLSQHAYDWFDDAPEGSLYVLNFSLDYYPDRCIRHKRHKWVLSLDTQMGLGGQLLALGSDEFKSHLDAHPHFYTPKLRNDLIRIHEHVRVNYEYVDKVTPEQAMVGVEKIIARLPPGSRCIFTVHHPVMRDPATNSLFELPACRNYADILKGVVQNYTYVGVISYTKAISSDDEIVSGNHYTRAVYLRFANRIAELAPSLELKPNRSTRLE